MIEHKDACESCVIFINITSISIDIFERSFLSKHMADTSKNNLTTSMVESFRFKHLFAKVMDGWKAPNLFFIQSLFCFGRWIQHRFHNSESRIVKKYSFDGPRFLELIQSLIVSKNLLLMVPDSLNPEPYFITNCEEHIPWRMCFIRLSWWIFLKQYESWFYKLSQFPGFCRQ